MQAQAVTRTTAVDLPAELETTPAETVDELQATPDLSKLTLFSLLSTLIETGAVECDDGRYAAC